MAENFINTLNGATTGAPSQSAPKPTEAKGPKKEVGKDEFIRLLVAQLKHQDPLDPVKNEDFAVNLAQFSQLEQLISINEKLSSEEEEGSFGSLSSYLGREVTLDSTEVHVGSGESDRISFELGESASQASIQLLDGQGRVAEVLELGELEAGKHVVDLAERGVPSGTYGFRISAASPSGVTEPEGRVSGVVSGFVPGPEPLLIVGGREISPGDVREVRISTSE